MTQTQRNGITLAALAAVALGAGTYWMAGPQAEATVKVEAQDQIRRKKPKIQEPKTVRRDTPDRGKNDGKDAFRRDSGARKGRTTVQRRGIGRKGVKVKKHKERPAA